MTNVMTWKEFKQFVDNEIKKHGIQTNHIEIKYIDIAYPSSNHVINEPDVRLSYDLYEEEWSITITDKV